MDARLELLPRGGGAGGRSESGWLIRPVALSRRRPRESGPQPAGSTRIRRGSRDGVAKATKGHATSGGLANARNGGMVVRSLLAYAWRMRGAWECGAE